MEAAAYLYRGLEVRLLVYPRQRTMAGTGHSYDQGFDAAVRINEPGQKEVEGRSRVFQLKVERGFENIGDARRASTAFAEHLIDACPSGRTIWDAEV